MANYLCKISLHIGPLRALQPLMHMCSLSRGTRRPALPSLIPDPVVDGIQAVLGKLAMQTSEGQRKLLVSMLVVKFADPCRSALI